MRLRLEKKDQQQIMDWTCNLQVLNEMMQTTNASFLKAELQKGRDMWRNCIKQANKIDERIVAVKREIGGRKDRNGRFQHGKWAGLQIWCTPADYKSLDLLPLSVIQDQISEDTDPELLAQFTADYYRWKQTIEDCHAEFKALRLDYEGSSLPFVKFRNHQRMLQERIDILQKQTQTIEPTLSVEQTPQPIQVVYTKQCSHIVPECETEPFKQQVIENLIATQLDADGNDQLTTWGKEIGATLTTTTTGLVLKINVPALRKYMSEVTIITN